MKRLLLCVFVMLLFIAPLESHGAYPTTTEHHKVYPYTSIMASPYSGDPTGVVDCAAAIESIKTNQSNIGTIYIPKGTFRIGTNISIPAGMTLEFASAAYFTIDAAVTLTLPGPVVAPEGQSCFIGSGTLSLGTTFPVANMTKILQPGTWAVSVNTSIPSNIELRPRKGAVLAIATGVTLTINGSLDAGPYQIFSCTGTGTVAFGKATTLYAEWFGAAGDNSTDDYIPLQKAITVGQACGGTVQLLGRTYYSSDTLDIPVTGVNNLCKFTLRGENRSFCDTINSPDGTVIRVPASKDAISLPVLTAPNNTLSYWAKHITIADIYVQGPLTSPTSFVDTKGFRFGGVQFLQAHNLHAEGFGYGIYLTDCSEVEFTGVTMTQNNYYGFYGQRYSSAPGVDLTDFQAWCEHLITVGDYIPILLDNPRSFFVKAGENVSIGWTRTDQPRIKITNCWSNSQVHFNNYIMENDEESIECVNVDSSGISILTFDNCNFESSYNRIVKCEGYFDQITITNSLLDRTYLEANPYPLVELSNAGTIESTGWARAQQVTLNGNSPPWADFAVKNSTVGKSPYRDYVPAGFQQVNGRRELDEAGDNRLTALSANIAFTTTDALCGKARAYFTVATTTLNGFTILPARALKGAEIIYVTCIVDDNSGAAPPSFGLIIGAGAGPTDFNNPYTVKLETYTVGTRTFTKYGTCFVIMNKTLSYTTGVTGFYVFNLYGNPGADEAKSGIECANVYVDSRQVGWVEPVVKKQEAAPAAVTEGYYAVGDVVYKLTPASGSPPKWYCTVAGNPGTWAATANLP